MNGLTVPDAIRRDPLWDGPSVMEMVKKEEAEMTPSEPLEFEPSDASTEFDKFENQPCDEDSGVAERVHKVDDDAVQIEERWMALWA